ncbi:LysR family transcriptional regulator [Paraburkholderia bengalensis]|uniref:LysR family transcriptional regulator n=1 Tax=Paraburkholderia bengalensis TaxID=2747562 RepID=A0ABU8J288_9BURK
MNHLFAMRAFVLVAETKNFRRAARELNVSNAVISRAVAYLEERLHTRLMNRTTRAVSLTEAGKHYRDGCRGILEELDHLDTSTSSAERAIAGVLRIVATDTLSPQLLTTIFEGFQRRFPCVQVRVSIAAQVPDRFEDQYDAGLLVVSPSADVNFVQLALVTQNLVLCAADSYLSRRPSPQEPGELGMHACIETTKEYQGSVVWHLADANGSRQCVHTAPSFTTDSASLLRLAAIAGMGIALMPESLIAEDLETGLLTRVLPGYGATRCRERVSLYYPHRRFLPSVTQAFVSYMLEFAGPVGRQSSSTDSEQDAPVPESATS